MIYYENTNYKIEKGNSEIKLSCGGKILATQWLIPADMDTVAGNIKTLRDSDLGEDFEELPEEVKEWFYKQYAYTLQDYGNSAFALVIDPDGEKRIISESEFRYGKQAENETVIELNQNMTLEEQLSADNRIVNISSTETDLQNLILLLSIRQRGYTTCLQKGCIENGIILVVDRNQQDQYPPKMAIVFDKNIMEKLAGSFKPVIPEKEVLLKILSACQSYIKELKKAKI